MFSDPLKSADKRKGLLYDERSSCFVHMGADYGLGRKTPVGNRGKTLKEVPTMPMKNKKAEGEYYEANKKFKD